MDKTSILFFTIFSLFLITILYGLVADPEMAESMAILTACLAIPFLAYRIQQRNLGTREPSNEELDN